MVLSSNNRRYSALRPLERTQTDTLWTGLTDNYDHRVYMVGIIDDCSRYGYGELWNEKGGFAATSNLESYIAEIGQPELLQTDNGIIERLNKTVLREFSARVPDGLPLEEYQILFEKYL